MELSSRESLAREKHQSQNATRIRESRYDREGGAIKTWNNRTVRP